MLPPRRVKFDRCPEDAPSSDPLENLSRFAGVCRCCGRVTAFQTRKEYGSRWVACGCGHVFEIPAMDRWH